MTYLRRLREKYKPSKKACFLKIAYICILFLLLVIFHILKIYSTMIRIIKTSEQITNFALRTLFLLLAIMAASTAHAYDLRFYDTSYEFYPGSTIIVPIVIENELSLRAFQFDFSITDGYDDFELISVEKSDRMPSDAIIIIGNDCEVYRVLAVGDYTSSSLNTCVDAGSGFALYLTIKVSDDVMGEYQMMLDNIQLVAEDGGVYDLPECFAYIYTPTPVYPWLELNQINAELWSGETLQLSATIRPDYYIAESVTWATSDSSVATVDANGLVIGVAPGTAIITATTDYYGEELSGTCLVTVKQQPVTGIALNATNLGLHVGDTFQLSADVAPDNASNKSLTWFSGSPSVASVDANGLVTAKAVGTTIITARATDGSNVTSSCTVTVVPNIYFTLDTLTHIRGEAVELIEIPISFYNRNEISAIQFDISLPGCASFGYPVIRVEDSRLTSSHSFSFNKLNDKSYRVLIASPSSAVLNGNDGPLVYLNVMLSKAVETTGDYYINISNIIAAEPDETRHVLDNVKSVVRYYYIVGDVDADLSVDIADYMATASKILARTPSPFYSDAADVDENSLINVTDLVGITNISLGIKPITLLYAPRRGMGLDLLTCDGPLMIAAGLERSITLNLEAGFDFAAFQMDLSLPQGLTLVGAELGGEASRLQLTWATLPDGNVRLLSSSFSDVDVQGDCPGLLTLKVKAEDDFGGYHSSIGLSNITFAERNLASHEFDDMDVECCSSIAVSELDDATRIFVEEGHIIVETPVEGTVVVSDISGHTREYPVFAGRNDITPWCNGVMMIRYNKQILKINLK